jgi:hypothetical protein
MVKNSLNINKTYNHLSPQLNEHKTTTTYDIINLGSGLRQAQQYCGVKPVNVITTLTFCNFEATCMCIVSSYNQCY